jgi:phosphoglycolate phosphatase
MSNSSRLRLVVFDCDGTLVDSQHSILSAMHGAFGAHGMPLPDHAAVRRIIGLELEAAVANLLPGADSALHRDIAMSYREAYRDNRTNNSANDPLFPGAKETVEAMSAAGWPLGIATGKSRRGVTAVLEMHGLARHFVTIQSSDSGPGKPNPAMLLQAMAEAGAEPDDTVMIGDTTYDMEMAANAGAHALGVAWGYHEIEELCHVGARHVVDSFSEIPSAVEKLFGNG